MEVLYRYISGGVAALVALLAPVMPLVWSVTAFILFDFITGVAASYCEARRNNCKWYFESRTAWHTVQKLGFTIVALCMAYLIDTLNNDETISNLLNPVKRIQTLMDKHRKALESQMKMDFED